MDVKLEGADRLARVFQKATDSGTVNQLKQAMTSTANKVLLDAKKLTPVDLGPLRDSGAVKEPEVTPNSISVSITFGGPSASYALFVHEDMTAFHDDGQAKFLEIPATEAAPSFVRSVMARYANSFRSA